MKILALVRRKEGKREEERKVERDRKWGEEESEEKRENEREKGKKEKLSLSR